MGAVPERTPMGHSTGRLWTIMAMPGIISLLINRITELTSGAKMASPGISDLFQNLCFAVALWNGKDHILKERLFGLGNNDGNHGEDVKELYYYLDNIPTHYYMEYLYKYPQNEFPYEDYKSTKPATVKR